MLQTIARFRPKPGRLVLPDVCCDVLCIDGRVLVSGPLTRAIPSAHVGEEVVLLRIDPLAARQLLRVPLAELTDRVLPRRAHALAVAVRDGGAWGLQAFHNMIPFTPPT